MHYSSHLLSKIKKKLLEPIQSYKDGPFLGPKWSICPKKAFWGKIINNILIYLLTNFIVPNFKIIFTTDAELGGCLIFGHKMGQFAQTKIFPKTF